MQLHGKAGWKVGALLLVSAVAAFGQASQATAPQAQSGNPSAQASPASHLPARADPGTINYVEGQASIDGQPLSSESAGNATLNSGQVLETSQNGFVEVLLTPGAYLRLGHDSEMRMLNAGLAATKVQLLHGKAMLEVDHLMEGTDLAVEMHGATTQILDKGLYAFDMHQKAVKVMDGKVNVAEASGNRILRGGHQVLLASANPLKWRNFSKDAVRHQELYVWSKARSRAQMEANQSAANEVVVNGGWYGPGWYWAPYWNSYAFLSAYGYPYYAYPYRPFGWGFYAPYSYGRYYTPIYRGHRGWHGVHQGWHGGHQEHGNGGHVSQRELSNRVHQLFSGKGK
ncbi:MAG TPA: FecR domain-containing protein [Bryobacteraceae bacterium]